MDALGNALVVWTQYVDTEGTSQIFLSEYLEHRWSHPVDVADFISDAAKRASRGALAMNVHGDAVIVWVEHDCLGYSTIVLIERRNGSNWSEPKSISPVDFASKWPAVFINMVCTHF